MPNINLLFEKYVTQLKLLRDNKLIDRDGDYICPICLKSFGKEQIKDLSLEDAPEFSLGGRKISITCKKCNNTCGHIIDNHLVNFIDYLERKDFLPGSDRRVTIDDNEMKINGILVIDDNDNFKMVLPNKINNPQKLKEHISKIEKDVVIDITNVPLKIDMEMVSAAIVKNAYILLFARFGYTFLLDNFYDRIRDYILNPTKSILPPLWTKQTYINAQDGVYFSHNNIYRGFFVLYSLMKLKKHRFCVCIPTPQVYYEAISNYFRENEPGTPISLVSSKDIDYFQNIDNIKLLRKWLSSWNLNAPVI